uniref:Protein kinase domain-containing protein n=1 Tax=Fagus sylvatica TaxID=28930 RepID=A0A2N9EYK6_FAGSY
MGHHLLVNMPLDSTRQGDGFAVGIFLAKIPQKTVVWTANRDNAPVPADVTLNFTSDGRMVLQSAQGTEITKVVNFVGAATSAASASMLDTGNFVLYDSDNQTILWESFKNPTDTILPTQQLSADGQDKYVLVSSVSESNHSTGLFRALMQQDGATLNLGVDGHLYLASDNNTVTIICSKKFYKRCTLPFENGCRWILAAVLTQPWIRMLKMLLAATVFLDLHLLTATKLLQAVQGISPSHVFALKIHLVTKTIVLSDEDVGPRSFTYAELERVTDNFKEELGRGAFGIVYKGAIGNGNEICSCQETGEICWWIVKESFRTEMKVIGRTHHKNLICLLGYCHDGSNRLLVYEYMSNGSLADILFTPGNKPCWDERIEIAYNVAKGILYLHEDCVPQIIHCDIKPQNILMDENMCAKISDFGLAKLLKSDQTKTLTGIRGTRGYVAPEWLRKVSHVTVKVDVYSFGIVLLEIICCRKSVDSDLPENEAILEEWTYDCFERGELSKLVNDEKVDNRQLERMVKVALWCILDDPSLRPSMKKVLLMLEGTMDIPIPPNPTSVLSVT